MENDLHGQLIDAMCRLDEDKVMALTQRLLREGYDRYTIFRLLDQGASRVGKLFEKGEYFIADLIVSGTIYSEVLSRFHFRESDRKSNDAKTILIGVARSDIHDIGKDIVCSLLRSEGLNVIDLGVDVDAEQFVSAAMEHRPGVVALSGVLAYSAVEMGNTIRALDAAGVREFASILIGGICVDDTVCQAVQADGWAKDPMETLKFCMEKGIEQDGQG